MNDGYTKNPSDMCIGLPESNRVRKACTDDIIFFWCPTRVTPISKRSAKVSHATYRGKR